jgi:hypothetical protein
MIGKSNNSKPGSLCFIAVRAAMKQSTKRPSISCDHPIKYCGRRCNRHAFQTLHPEVKICDVHGPGRTESACAGPTQRIPCPACGGLANQTKILGHNVNSEDVRGATSVPRRANRSATPNGHRGYVTQSTADVDHLGRSPWAIIPIRSGGWPVMAAFRQFCPIGAIGPSRRGGNRHCTGPGKC